MTACAVRAGPRRAGEAPASGNAVVLALETIYFAWSGTFSGTKIALESIPPLVLASSRFIVAAVLLLALAGRQVWPGVAEWRPTVWAGLILVGVGSSLLVLGQVHVDSGLASLIVASVPLCTLGLGAFVGHRPTRGAVSAVVLGFAGLARDRAAARLHARLGERLVLSQQMRLPVATLVSAGFQIVGGVAVAAYAVVDGEVGAMVTTWLTTRSMLAWVVLAGACTTVGYSTYGWLRWLLQNASLRLATTCAYVNPVVAVAIGSPSSVSVSRPPRSPERCSSSAPWPSSSPPNVELRSLRGWSPAQGLGLRHS